MTYKKFKEIIELYDKIDHYRSILNAIKEARESGSINRIFVDTILIPDNGIDFSLLLIKIEETIEQLYKQYNDEFERL